MQVTITAVLNVRLWSLYIFGHAVTVRNAFNEEFDHRFDRGRLLSNAFNSNNNSSLAVINGPSGMRIAFISTIKCNTSKTTVPLFSSRLRLKYNVLSFGLCVYTGSTECIHMKNFVTNAVIKNCFIEDCGIYAS